MNFMELYKRWISEEELIDVYGGTGRSLSDAMVFDYAYLPEYYDELMNQGFCINCWQNLRDNRYVQIHKITMKAERIGNTLVCRRCGMKVINIPEQ